MGEWGRGRRLGAPGATYHFEEPPFPVFRRDVSSLGAPNPGGPPVASPLSEPPCSEPLTLTRKTLLPGVGGEGERMVEPSKTVTVA